MFPLRSEAALTSNLGTISKVKNMASVQLLEQLLHRNVQRHRGGLVFKAHRLCASLNSRLESNKEERVELLERLSVKEELRAIKGGKKTGTH